MYDETRIARFLRFERDRVLNKLRRINSRGKFESRRLCQKLAFLSKHIQTCKAPCTIDVRYPLFLKRLLLSSARKPKAA